MQLSERLREVRQQRKLTLAQVTGQTGLARTYLSDLENEWKRPTLDTLALLASSYGLSVMDLLSGVDFAGTASHAGLGPGLAVLVERGMIDEQTARDLNSFELRGARPQTEEEWYELYLHLKRIVQPYWLRQDDASAGRAYARQTCTGIYQRSEHVN